MLWFVLAAWLMCAGLGGYVAAQNRRIPAQGIILGLLFGPLGLLVVACLPIGDQIPPRRGTGDGTAPVVAIVALVCLFLLIVAVASLFGPVFYE